jgi:hypothetical protein
VLADGEASGAHVDIVTRALRPLTPDQRAQLAARGDVLAVAAAQLSREEFARTVRGEVRRICANDGLDRLEQQRRATSLRTWVDRQSGMWCLHGEFDPETGLRLDASLKAMVETLFHTTTPDTSPADPLAKQHHLRALALAAICERRGSGRARTEVSVLIDAATLLDSEHEKSVIDLGLAVDLPVETIQRMACNSDIVVPIITAANGVALHLGRDHRVANRAQRRALRAMYRGCAVPGCAASWDQVEIHHVTWFGHGGHTDINDLLPLCRHTHHHKAHEGLWRFKLDANRNLTITYPDGTTMTTGPPNRNTP